MWEWERSDRVVPLARGEVDVWLVELRSESLDREACRLCLSQRERVRAERFTHEGAHDEYVVSRAILRVLLAGYVGVDPVDLSFRNAPGGKPFLIAVDGRPSGVQHDTLTRCRAVRLLGRW